MTAGHGMLTHCLLSRPPDHAEAGGEGPARGFPCRSSSVYLPGLGGRWGEGLYSVARHAGKAAAGAPQGQEGGTSPGLLPRGHFLPPGFTLSSPSLPANPPRSHTQGQMVRKSGSPASGLHFRHLFGQGLRLKPFLKTGFPRATGLSLCTPTHSARDTVALEAGSRVLGPVGWGCKAPRLLSHSLGHLWAALPLLCLLTLSAWRWAEGHFSGSQRGCRVRGA